MRLPRLTPRQRDLIRLAAIGCSDKEIATNLNLATRTVSVMMQRLRDTIGPFNRHMLPGIGLLLGIISVSDITMPALELLQDRFLIPSALDEMDMLDNREGAD